jgi:hypothetical protein
MPLKGGFANLWNVFIGRMPSDSNLLSLDASLASRRVSSASKHLGAGGQGGQTAPPGRLDWPGRSDRPQAVWPPLLGG